MKPVIAIYPGTFDPFTHGHNDLVRRAAAMFDRVTVAIAESQRKAPFFATSDRVDMARAVLADVTAEPVGCSPLNITYEPPSYPSVPGGTTLTFVETIAVPAGVTPEQLPPDGGGVSAGPDRTAKPVSAAGPVRGSAHNALDFRAISPKSTIELVIERGLTTKTPRHEAHKE